MILINSGLAEDVSSFKVACNKGTQILEDGLGSGSETFELRILQ